MKHVIRLYVALLTVAWCHARPVQTAPNLRTIQRNSPTVVMAGSEIAFNFDTEPGSTGPGFVRLRIVDPTGAIREVEKQYQYHGAVALATTADWPAGHYSILEIILADANIPSASYRRDGSVIPTSLPPFPLSDWPYSYPTSHQLDLAALDFDLAPSAGGTAVAGTISNSVAWTAAGSPYRLSDKVQIAAGATLTLEPGASIVGGGNTLEVAGRFNAIGTAERPAVLNNVIVAPATTTAADPYVIDIEHAQVFGGAVLPTPASTTYGSLTLRDSYLVNVAADHIYVRTPVANASIERNVFIESGGILVGTEPGSANVSIKNNVFWRPAVLHTGETYATDSLITVFAVTPGTTTVSGNSILEVENLYYGLWLTTNATVNAAGNYFGPLDDLRIGFLLRADQTPNGRGTITVTPWLTEPAAETPAAPVAPEITVEPQSTSVATNGVATFTVAAVSPTGLWYQWLKDGVSISGATDASYSVLSASAVDAGTYSVRVTNGVGVTQSAGATLAVAGAEPSQENRLTNVSVRTAMQAGQGSLVVGFVTNRAKPILMRAAGPALTRFDVADPLADPKIELYRSGGAQPVVNDDWDSALAPAFTPVQAFPFTPGSKDAALLETIDGTASIHALATGSGVVLVEAYDAGGVSTSGRLINVSASNQVGTGDHVLIAGFAIEGSGAKRLLIRGIGPGLAGFGVKGTLANPKVEVFNAAGVKLIANDDWDSSLASTFAACNAFDLPRGSKDAALVVNLSAGATYSAIVSGADGGSGVGLVEVYEVP